MCEEPHINQPNLMISIRLLCIPMLVLGVFCSTLVNGQVNDEAIPELDSLKKIYTADKIDDTTFMNGVVKSVKYSFYSSPLFKDFVEYYKTIAFKNKRYGKYRAQYYKFLSNIALFHNNDGARVFYAEKIDEELKKIPGYIPSLSSTMIEVNWLANWKMAEKGLAKYQRVRGFIDSLPGLIPSKNIPYLTVHNAMHLVKYVHSLYLGLNDTLNANRQHKLANDIVGAAAKRKDIYSDDNMGQFEFVRLYIKYQKWYHLKDYPATEQSLRHILALSETGKAKGFSWAESQFINMHLSLADLFNEVGRPDSAAKYLSLYKEGNLGKDKTWGADENFYQSNSHLLFAKGEYKEAYAQLQKAYKIKDSIIDIRMSDITNNMYAQTQAEFNKNELDKSKKQKRQRNQLIILITALSGLGIIALYRQLVKKDRIAQQNIEKLRTASQLQIVELEERNRVIKKEEQQRLGMELHDDLAGSIASVKMSMEEEIISATDPVLKDRLAQLRDRITHAYQRTRNKSHDLYYSMKESESSFKLRIQSLLDTGLSNRSFRKEVSIEEEVLQQVPLTIKIEFLYIIQEAITNILKHAKASAVDIFIYKEEEGVVLQINDNGKGFDVAAKAKGMGLRSIQQRVLSLQGNLQIESGKTGTSLIIKVPAAS